MKISRRQALLASISLASIDWATAQSGAFPNRTIKIIVPFTAGSGSDSSARFFGDRIAPLLGQAVIVENRPGASGIIALQAVKNAPADGYTVLLASNSPMAVNPLVIKDLGYDSVRDYKPVYGLTRGMNVIVVSNESPFHSLEELLTAAKQKSLTVGTYSAGYELAASWLSGISGAKFTNVLYKGQAPIMTDVIGNQIDLALVDIGGAIPLLKAGKLRALAVSGETRHIDFPAIPTIRERGFNEYVTYSWVSFYVRSQTPNDVTLRLADAMRQVLARPEAEEFMRKTGGEPMAYPPEKMQAFHLAEIERYRKIAAAAGVKPE